MGQLLNARCCPPSSSLSQAGQQACSKTPRLASPITLLPLVVEPSLAQRLAEGGPVGIREFKPFGLKLRLQGVAELLDIGALKQRGLVDVAADNLLEIGGQALPSAPVAQNQYPSHM